MVNLDRNTATSIAKLLYCELYGNLQRRVERVHITFKLSEDKCRIEAAYWDVVFGEFPRAKNIDGWLIVIQVNDKTGESELLSQY